MINIGQEQIGSYLRENYMAGNLLKTKNEFDCLLKYPFTTDEFNFPQPLILPKFFPLIFSREFHLLF